MCALFVGLGVQEALREYFSNCAGGTWLRVQALLVQRALYIII